MQSGIGNQVIATKQNVAVCQTVISVGGRRTSNVERRTMFSAAVTELEERRREEAIKAGIAEETRKAIALFEHSLGQRIVEDEEFMADPTLRLESIEHSHTADEYYSYAETRDMMRDRSRKRGLARRTSHQRRIHATQRRRTTGRGEAKTTRRKKRTTTTVRPVMEAASVARAAVARAAAAARESQGVSGSVHARPWTAPSASTTLATAGFPLAAPQHCHHHPRHEDARFAGYGRLRAVPPGSTGGRRYRQGGGGGRGRGGGGGVTTAATAPSFSVLEPIFFSDGAKAGTAAVSQPVVHPKPWGGPPPRRISRPSPRLYHSQRKWAGERAQLLQKETQTYLASKAPFRRAVRSSLAAKAATRTALEVAIGTRRVVPAPPPPPRNTATATRELSPRKRHIKSSYAGREARKEIARARRDMEVFDVNLLEAVVVQRLDHQGISEGDRPPSQLAPRAQAFAEAVELVGVGDDDDDNTDDTDTDDGSVLDADLYEHLSLSFSEVVAQPPY